MRDQMARLSKARFLQLANGTTTPFLLRSVSSLLNRSLLWYKRALHIAWALLTVHSLIKDLTAVIRWSAVPR